MQTVWLMTMFVFAAAFFLVFFAIYFFRPKKKDKIVPLAPEKEVLDPEEITLPHRAEPNWPATLETAAGANAEATIVNITHGSAFITSSLEMAIGERFQINVLLPDRPPLQLRGEVTWSNMHLPPEKVMKRGMGIRFIEAGADAVCLINDTINRQGTALKTAPGSTAE